jgi:DNA-binding protein H-NS
MTTLNDLLAQRAELESQIAAQRPAAIAQVRDLMKQLGVTAADLGFRSGKPAPTHNPAPVKYRDAAGNTWSGRGFKPVWLRDRLANGAMLEDFAV